MNFIGKILVLLICVMSIFFMAFAVMVYSTHKNWYAASAKYKKERDDKKAEVDRISSEMKKQGEASQASKTELESQLAKAQTQLKSLKSDNTRLETEYGKTLTRSEETLATLKITEDNLEALRAEALLLRDRVRLAQKERDEKDKELVQRTDELRQKTRETELLSASNIALLSENTRFSLVLQDNNINPSVAIHNPPANLKSEIIYANGTDLVEVSSGSDDGLREGHFLEIVRDNRYMGRLQVVRTQPDKAVARILPEYRTGKIQKGDSVRSRIN